MREIVALDLYILEICMPGRNAMTCTPLRINPSLLIMGCLQSGLEITQVRRLVLQTVLTEKNMHIGMLEMKSIQCLLQDKAKVLVDPEPLPSL